MKREAVPTQRVRSALSALFFAVSLTLIGCSAGTITGPDLAPSETATVQQDGSLSNADAAHNESDSADKRGTRSGSVGRN